MIGVVIIVLVVIAALFVIVSGLWVARALIAAISANGSLPDIQQTDEQNSEQDDSRIKNTE